MGRPRCAILIRGHSQRQENNHIYSGTIRFDCKDGSLDSFLTKVLIPIQYIYKTDVYVSVSDTRNKEYILSKIKKTVKRVFYMENIVNDPFGQKRGIIDGLNSIKKADCFYRNILVTRFDLLYKEELTNFLLKKNEDIIYPFMEATSDIFVSDTIQWINNKENNENLDVLIRAWYAQDSTGHRLKMFTDGKITAGFMVEGGYDSCTSRPPSAHGGLQLSKNPIYVQSGRHYHYDDFYHPTLIKP